ncbi:MAG: hypothetical protein SGPRY_000828, partial [Prymnesium sp.]
MCAANIAKVTELWCKYHCPTEPTKPLNGTGGSGDGSTLWLLELMEKLVIFQEAAQIKEGYDLVADKVALFAEKLAAQGCLAEAMSYLVKLNASSPLAAELVDRIHGQNSQLLTAPPPCPFESVHVGTAPVSTSYEGYGGYDGYEGGGYGGYDVAGQGEYDTSAYAGYDQTQYAAYDESQYAGYSHSQYAQQHQQPPNPTANPSAISYAHQQQQPAPAPAPPAYAYSAPSRPAPTPHHPPAHHPTPTPVPAGPARPPAPAPAPAAPAYTYSAPSVPYTYSPYTAPAPTPSIPAALPAPAPAPPPPPRPTYDPQPVLDVLLGLTSKCGQYSLAPLDRRKLDDVEKRIHALQAKPPDAAPHLALSPTSSVTFSPSRSPKTLYASPCDL